jgi:hypothetical protein
MTSKGTGGYSRVGVAAEEINSSMTLELYVLSSESLLEI